MSVIAASPTSSRRCYSYDIGLPIPVIWLLVFVRCQSDTQSTVQLTGIHQCNGPLCRLDHNKLTQAVHLFIDRRLHIQSRLMTYSPLLAATSTCIYSNNEKNYVSMPTCIHYRFDSAANSTDTTQLPVLVCAAHTYTGTRIRAKRPLNITIHYHS